MYERLMQFSGQIMVVASAALVFFIYLQCMNAWYKKNNDGTAEWMKKNKTKILWIVGAPVIFLYSPLVENLIFQLPLILIFNSVSHWAWIGIMLSTALLGLAHIFDSNFTINAMTNDVKKNPVAQTQDAEHTTCETEKSYIHRASIIQTVIACLVNIVLSYYGIAKQSLYAVVGLRMVWSVIAIPLGMLVGLIIALVFITIPEYFYHRKMRKLYPRF